MSYMSNWKHEAKNIEWDSMKLSRQVSCITRPCTDNSVTTGESYYRHNVYV